ncbi:hypothetical protein K450DRAFT_235293 [Umbelopsis ramanniana AG]|uniref:Inhibitor I9 domain-containing protein n=1 Tax=Umbelopsis ramanniana AG TaxID=1314678 RepID=A0AAD5ECK6_UMBRA|nr:uncharacterized protein K450DRAFT_235293 [Umbelopsis ramanniana AG]KAI8580927.1 hypothetical protein K450DRAFT_235293 [Umbelopsis ramanniana AG]
MRSIISIITTVALTALLSLNAYAAKAGYTDFIMVFNRDISDSDFKKAQDDVLAANGVINHKYTAGLKGLSVSLPDNKDGLVNTFEAKDYVKFIETDQTVHTQN